MSEENNNLGDDIKKGAEEAAESVKETAKEFAEEAKEVLDSQDNKKILAGILAIVLGSLGVHKFILGYQKEGFILLGFSIIAYVLSCFVIGVFFIWIPGLIGLIEGIIYLTKSDEEFYQTYQVGKKPWF
ncbi:TM2 domain-containing protein [Aquimarina spongiae]|uniref:TM2 domain-containing membrane protein YozV n=1 Tax=Aquimarina spongiae TaxID=570521 RepID=A0A1M6L7F7_9FLAO|nr:TM2 domain-containing protein [Aquimarina spongiae]SHJ67122.1 TM2 domain-containing membrane protein YozV [Aquimarina spongiae]